MSEEFFVTGGTLPLAAESYVARAADALLLEGLQAGEFCYVLDTRQMGKSSLMVRTARRLKEDGRRVVVLDLTSIGQNLSVEQWYSGLMARTAAQTDRAPEMFAFWKDHREMGPMQRFVETVRRVLLSPPAPGMEVPPLVLFVDEIDAVRALPFSADEFFGGIRECYNRRPQDPAFARLTFCLLGVAAPADLIRDTRLSPFNIGRRIELNDFTPDEAAPLAQGLGRKGPGGHGPGLLKRVLHWTGGHPYVTQRLCRAVTQEGAADARAVDRLCARLFLSGRARETDDNLAFVRARLLGTEGDLAAMLDLYRQVWIGRAVIDDETNPLCAALRLSGVATVCGGHLRVRNRIYRSVFDRNWVTAHLPGAELRRQRDAYRRGVGRAAAAASVVLLLMGLLSAAALREKSSADRNARQARAAQGRTLAALVAEQQAETNAHRLAQVAQSRSREASLSATAALREKSSADRNAGQARAAQARAVDALTAERQAKQEEQRLAQVAQSEAGRARQGTENARRQTQEALRQKDLADRQKDRADHARQVAFLAVAGQVWNSPGGLVATVASLLADSRTSARFGDERFEWRYLWGQLHKDTLPGGAGTGGDIAATPGGGLAALNGAGRLRRLNPDGQTRLARLLPGPLAAEALSPDGTRLVTAQPDGVLTVRDADTLRPVASWQTGRRDLAQVRFSGDGQRVVAVFGAADVQADAWDAASGRPAGALTVPASALPGSAGWQGLVGATVSDDLHRIAQADTPDSGKISVLDAARLGQKGAAPVILSLGDVSIRSLAFSSDGRTLAAGDVSGSIGVWDAATGVRHGAARVLATEAGALAISPDGTQVAAGGPNGLIRLWTVATTAITSLKGLTGAVGRLRFSPDGAELAGGDDTGAARLFRLADFAPQSREMPRNGLMEGLAVSPDGQFAAVYRTDDAFHLWDLRTGQDVPLPPALRGGALPGGGRCFITSVAYSPDNRTVAMAGLHTPPPSRPGAPAVFLQFWDRVTGRLGPSWQAAMPETLQVSPAQTARGLVSQPMMGYGLRTLVFSPDGRTVAGGCGDVIAPGEGESESQGTWDGGFWSNAVLVWDASSARLRRVLPDFTNSIHDLAFSPDGKLLAVAAMKSAACFDTRTWAQTRRLTSPTGVLSVAFSPDGGRLAVGQWNGNVQLTETHSWTTALLSGQSEQVKGLAFSPDGRTLASASWDGTVKLWDASSREEMYTFRPPEALCQRVVFSPDGTRLACTAGSGVYWFPAPASAQVASQARTASGGYRQAGASVAWEERAPGPALLADVVARRTTAGRRPASPAENLLGLPGGAHGYWFAVRGGSKASLRTTPDGAATVTVTQPSGMDWHVMLGAGRMALAAGRTYRVQFRARADRPQIIRFDTEDAAPPYDHNGLEETLALSPQWQAVRCSFVAQGTHGPSTLCFTLGQGVNRITIADAVLVPETPPASSPR